MKSVLMFDTGVATLNTGDEIINYSIKKNWPEIYNDNYSYFANHKKASVEPVSAIVDVIDMQRIDFDGLRWIVNNRDNLMRTNEKRVLLFVAKNMSLEK